MQKALVKYNHRKTVSVKFESRDLVSRETVLNITQSLNHYLTVHNVFYPTNNRKLTFYQFKIHTLRNYNINVYNKLVTGRVKWIRIGPRYLLELPLKLGESQPIKHTSPLMISPYTVSNFIDWCYTIWFITD